MKKTHKRKDGSVWTHERIEHGAIVEELGNPEVEKQKQKLKELEQQLERVTKVAILKNTVEKS